MQSLDATATDAEVRLLFGMWDVDTQRCGNILFYNVAGLVDTYVYLESGIDTQWAIHAIDGAFSFSSRFGDISRHTFIVVGGLEAALISIGHAWTQFAVKNYKIATLNDGELAAALRALQDGANMTDSVEENNGFLRLLQEFNSYIRSLEITAKGKSLNIAANNNKEYEEYCPNATGQRNAQMLLSEMARRYSATPNQKNCIRLLFRAVAGTIVTDGNIAVIGDSLRRDYGLDRNEATIKLAVGYIKHSLHTEVQLSSLNNHKQLAPNTGRCIFSLNDPCCGCIQLEYTATLKSGPHRFFSIKKDNYTGQKKLAGYSLLVRPSPPTGNIYTIN
ncbi:MAG: hypothetical protein LBF54_02745 [Holosporaceae bacterium]|jgi:hypothetical protein|nr:hypothetical protein [Holosporaceae bacterium]